ncbi:MAG: hypothetical protein PHH59_00405 [Methylovulum sp.]|uniref:hypothetical protein n=1 Tax=Methylovulum sp. TaxID=1916980 RepID=UPI00260B0944|nr:hypothetical protein [Methylovulum sp.]MDD2722467.1 hypothetical protein [Methylovulum sp.]MDD5125994.1 hypothetical protein [Methylovulum sp.]
MEKIKAWVIGEIGEYIAQKYLSSNGFQLVKYGKEMPRNTSGNHLKPYLTVCSDEGLDCAVGYAKSKYAKETPKTIFKLNINSPPYKKEFLIVNLLVNEYIQRYWWHFSEKNPLPHDWLKITQAQKKHGNQAAERLKNENREALKKFPGSGAHPGRYDFIGFKSGEYYAIEVKVNKSKLNYWQVIRLSLLQRYGCNIIVINICISKAQLLLAIAGKEPLIESIKLNAELRNSKIELPSDEEFIKILNYLMPHEK